MLIAVPRTRPSSSTASAPATRRARRARSSSIAAPRSATVRPDRSSTSCRLRSSAGLRADAGLRDVRAQQHARSSLLGHRHEYSAVEAPYAPGYGQRSGLGLLRKRVVSGALLRHDRHSRLLRVVAVTARRLEGARRRDLPLGLPRGRRHAGRRIARRRPWTRRQVVAPSWACEDRERHRAHCRRGRRRADWIDLPRTTHALGPTEPWHRSFAARSAIAGLLRPASAPAGADGERRGSAATALASSRAS